MPVSKITNENKHLFVTRKRNKSQNFSKETDRALQQIAAVEPYKKLKKVANNAFIATTLVAPIVDSFTTGIITQGTLSKKVGRMYKTLGSWGAALGVMGTVIGIKKAINKKSEKLNNFDKNHRITSFTIDMLAVYGGLNLAYSLLKKASNKINEKFPQAIKSFKTSTLNPIETMLNKSKINKKLVKNLDKAVNKNIYNKTAIQTSAKLLAPVIILSSFFRYINETVKKQNEFKENYVCLKEICKEKFIPEKKIN